MTHVIHNAKRQRPVAAARERRAWRELARAGWMLIGIVLMLSAVPPARNRGRTGPPAPMSLRPVH
jgi:hypothetical protein